VPECLSFRAGDIIRVTSTDPTGWWVGECNGVTGYFPSELCVTITPAQAAEAIRAAATVKRSAS
jgi:hypothetical protein